MMVDPEKDATGREATKAAPAADAGALGAVPLAPRVPVGTGTLVAERRTDGEGPPVAPGTETYRTVLRCRTRRAAD